MRLLRSLVLLLFAGAAAAQGRLVRATDARAIPGGATLATLEPRTTWRQGPTQRNYVRVTIEGWIDADRVGGRRDSFPQSTDGTGLVRLRAEPRTNAPVLAVFAPRTGIRVLERKGRWARIRRDAWVSRSAFEPASEPEATAAREAPRTAAATPSPASKAPAPAAPTAEPAPETPRSQTALRASRELALALAPGAARIGSLDKDAVVEPTARSRGWVRVRVEAWVPESLLTPTDSAYSASLRAVDLRLDPGGFVGRTVRWTVQVVGLQNADPLRKGFRPDEPYLLALGPSGENAVLYFAVPPALLAEARTIRSMSKVILTGTVRTGRSDPTGAPIIDLRAITRP
ncbi:MAG: Bacterial domain [Gemmatimonadota bacterium]|jgi:hypothetical protein